MRLKRRWQSQKLLEAARFVVFRLIYHFRDPFMILPGVQNCFCHRQHSVCQQSFLAVYEVFDKLIAAFRRNIFVGWVISINSQTDALVDVSWYDSEVVIREVKRQTVDLRRLLVPLHRQLEKVLIEDDDGTRKRAQQSTRQWEHQISHDCQVFTSSELRKLSAQNFQIYIGSTRRLEHQFAGWLLGSLFYAPGTATAKTFVNEGGNICDGAWQASSSVIEGILLLRAR